MICGIEAIPIAGFVFKVIKGTISLIFGLKKPPAQASNNYQVTVFDRPNSSSQYPEPLAREEYKYTRTLYRPRSEYPLAREEYTYTRTLYRPSSMSSVSYPSRSLSSILGPSSPPPSFHRLLPVQEDYTYNHQYQV